MHTKAGKIASIWEGAFIEYPIPKRICCIWGTSQFFCGREGALYVATNVEPTYSSYGRRNRFDLVDRNKPSLKLTEAGEIFIDRAQDIINIYNATLKECVDVNKNKSVVRVQDLMLILRFPEFYTEACQWLQEQEFLGDYMLKLTPSGHVPMEELLDKGIIDIGFVYSAKGMTDEIDHIRSQGFEGFRLYTEPCYLYTTADSYYGKLDKIFIDDLKGKTFIAINIPAFASFRRAVHDMFLSEGIDLEQKLYSGESPLDSPSSINFNEELVVTHRKHVQTVERYWDSQLYVERSIEDSNLEMDIYVVYHPALLSPSIKNLVFALKEVSTKKFHSLDQQQTLELQDLCANL